MIDSIRVKGHIKIVLKGLEDVIKQSLEIENTVTDLGKAHIADRLAAVPSQAVMANMAIGTGSPTTTALGAEVSRKALESRTASGAVVTYVGYWDIEDQISGTITEAGIFNSAVLGGTMLNSGTMSIVKELNDSLEITWTLTIL